MISPSELARAKACPGSYAAQRGMPWEESEAAEEGKLLHAAIYGKAIKTSLDLEQRGCIQICNERFQEMVTALELIGGKLYFEVGLYIDLPPHKRARCVLDAIVRKGNAALVVDWKFGRGDVDAADENLQLAGYAFAMFEAYSDIHTVHVAIIQPRVGPKQDGNRWVTYERQLHEGELRQLLKGIYDAAAAPQALRIPGQHCKYCKAAKQCPEAATAIAAVEPRSSLEPIPAAKLAEWLNRTSLYKSIVEDLEAEAKRRIEAGEEIPGWSLKSTGSRRYITNAQAAFGRLSEVIAADQFAAACTVRVGDIEQALAEALKLSKKEASQRLKDLLGDAIEVRPNQPSLVRIEAA